MPDKLVSIIIPTKNSGNFLKACLESIAAQDYLNIELLIGDGFSSDNTLSIARSFNAKIVQTDWKPLGARFLCLKEARGEYILFMDSDQQFTTSTRLGECVSLLTDSYDMLCLHERGYNISTWLQRLFEADRQYIHLDSEVYLNPSNSVLIPRFFKKDIVSSAFNNIPYELLSRIYTHDDSIVFYEAHNLSQRIGVVADALYHNDIASLSELWKKYYSYGRNTREMTNYHYHNLFTKRAIRKNRNISHNVSLWIQSNVLLCLKGFPYVIGRFCS